jgi:hypothetical protein
MARMQVRFSVRTALLLLSLAAAWLGWQASIVKERKSLLRIMDRDGAVIFYHNTSELPLTRRLMGDSAADWVMISHETDKVHGDRIRAAFQGVQIDVMEKVELEIIREDQGK